MKSLQIFGSIRMDGATDRMIAQDIAHHVHPRSNLRQHARDGSTMIALCKGVSSMTAPVAKSSTGFPGWAVFSWAITMNALRQMNTLPFAPTFYNLSHPKMAQLGERLVGMARAA